MNPDADDLYECLDAHPQEPHGTLQRKISRFVALHGTDYPAKKATIEQELKDLDSRKEYNRNHGYPTTFGDIVPLSIAGTHTVTVRGADGEPVSDATVVVDGTVLGTTGSDGEVAFEVEAESVRLSPDRN